MLSFLGQNKQRTQVPKQILVQIAQLIVKYPRDNTPIGETKMKEFSNEAYYLIFSTLANRTRLAIIDTLKETPKTITEISTEIQQEQSITSANLQQLEKCALVTSKKSDNKQLYSLNRETIEPLAHVLELHTAKYCPGLRVCIPPDKLKEYLKKEAAKDTFIEH